MKILDLFAGKGGELRRSKIEARGHELVTLDINPRFGCNITADIMKIDDLGLFDFIWASVPCEAFSVASISHHWDKETREPKTEAAKMSIELVKHTIQLMNESAKAGWLMENPVGMLRKQDFMSGIRRQEIHYCQYGETRMKPTDIWTVGINWVGRTACKRGDPCHEAAPRGSRTGTQGIKGADNRAIVPWELWEEILSVLEEGEY